MPPTRLLVVDDEPDVREVCRRALSGLGYELAEAASGAEAVALARGRPFDLLLLDFRMPGMNGLEAFQAIRAMQPDVLGVVMTAYAAVDNAVQAVNLGMSGFVLKPFNLRRLRDAVEDALDKRAREAERARASALGSLARLTTALTSTDVDAMLHVVARVAMEETRSDAASVSVPNGSEGEHHVAACGWAFECPRDVIDAATHPEVPTVFEVRRAVHPVIRHALQSSGLAFLAVARLEVPGHKLGLLCLGRAAGAQPYSDSDVETLKVLASQTAIAVNNVWLLNQVVERDRLNESLQRYLSPRIVHAVLNGRTVPGSVEDPRIMTVLVADVVDFSGLVEHTEVEPIIEVLHEYFSAAVEIISGHGGMVDELSGDEILASFERSPGREDDALRGVRAGLEMLERLAQLQAGWTRRDLPSIDIGIGISSGAVAIGTIGSGPRRASVTAGRILNLAARSQALTRELGPHLIVTQDTFEQVCDWIHYRELGAVRLKGISEPVGLYGVYGLKGD